MFLQHTSHSDGRNEAASRPGRSGARCRNSIASCADEQPHIGNYRLLKTIGKGNFAKVKLARHILTGREVSVLQIIIALVHYSVENWPRYCYALWCWCWACSSSLASSPSPSSRWWSCTGFVPDPSNRIAGNKLYFFSLLSFLQVAIKIIDKTQLNPTSLQKVNISVLLPSYKNSVRPPRRFTAPSFSGLQIRACKRQYSEQSFCFHCWRKIKH